VSSLTYITKETFPNQGKEWSGLFWPNCSVQVSSRPSELLEMLHGNSASATVVISICLPQDKASFQTTGPYIGVFAPPALKNKEHFRKMKLWVDVCVCVCVCVCVLCVCV
jgi:hypothetical protein